MHLPWAERWQKYGLPVQRPARRQSGFSVCNSMASIRRRAERLDYRVSESS